MFGSFVPKSPLQGLGLDIETRTVAIQGASGRDPNPPDPKLLEND